MFDFCIFFVVFKVGRRISPTSGALTFGFSTEAKCKLEDGFCFLLLPLAE